MLIVNTCSVFNSSLEYCSPLLCKGLTFNIQAVVYETDAVAKSSGTLQGEAVLDDSCGGSNKLQPTTRSVAPLQNHYVKTQRHASRSMKEASAAEVSFSKLEASF